MSGKPRKLMVSWRCTSAMARLFRARSNRLSARKRAASSIFCLTTGCSADSTKNSQRMSPNPMGDPPQSIEIEFAQHLLHGVGRLAEPLGAAAAVPAHRIQRRPAHDLHDLLRRVELPHEPAGGA